MVSRWNMDCFVKAVMEPTSDSSSSMFDTCLRFSLVFVLGCTAMETARTVPYDGDGGTNSGTGSSGSGLPCDVDTMLKNDCRSCHSKPPIGGAPMSLDSYSDLIAPAPTNHSLTVAALSLMRMQDASAPMPPSPASLVSSGDLSIFQNWVNSGMPSGTCSTDGGTDPYGTPVVCTSNTYSTAREGSRMAPGQACNNCHASSGEAPIFALAGTAYPTAHEPDDCNGVSAMQIVIVDANNRSITLTSNTAGNFDYSGSVALPYHAKIVANGRERAMSAAQTNGDCNSCHTETGASSAPGRIMAP